MTIDMTVILGLIKKLLLMIFEKFDVIKEFDAIGVDVVGLLNDAPAPEEEP